MKNIFRLNDTERISISICKEDLEKARSLFKTKHRYQEKSWKIFKSLLEFYIKNKGDDIK